MRNILLLSAVVALAACSDDQHATAPAGSRGANSRFAANGNLGSGQGDVRPQARPTDAVGFTKVTRVQGTPVTVNPGSIGFAQATCPTGSTLVSGGYIIESSNNIIPPVDVTMAHPSYPGTWVVEITNNVTNAGTAQATAIAMCLS